MNNPTVRNNNAFRPFAYLLLLIGTSIVGMAVGFWYYAAADQVFESEARFRITAREIEPAIEGLDFSSVTDGRHDELFAHKRNVMGALSKNKLYYLRAFENIPEDKVDAHVIENLSVAQNRKEPSIYRVTLRSNRPDDSQTVLNNLVDHYSKSLEKQVKTIEIEYLMKLKANSEAAVKELKSAENNQASEEVLVSLHKRRTALNEKFVALSLAGFDSQSQIRDVIWFPILQNASYGEQVWPTLPLSLLYGAAGGFLFGFLIILGWSFTARRSAQHHQS